MTAPGPDSGLLGTALRVSTMATFPDVIKEIAGISGADSLIELAGHLRWLAETQREIGRPRAAELSEYIAELCEGMARSPRTARGEDAPAGTTTAGNPPATSTRVAPPADGPGSFLELLRAAAARPGLLAAYRLLDRHRRLLPEHAVHDALHRLVGDPRAGREGYAPLIGVLGLVADDAESRIIGRAEWAVLLCRQGRFERAMFHATRAFSQQGFEGGSRSLSPASSALAFVLRSTRRLDECLRVEARALAAAADLTGVPPAELFSMRLQYAHDLQNSGRVRESLPVLAEAMELVNTRPELAPCEGDVLSLVARAYQERGAYAEAAEVLRRVIAFAERRHERQDWFIAHSELAHVLTLRGRTREAQRVLRECLAAGEREASPMLAPLRHHYAVELLQDKQYAAARHQLELSLAEASPRQWLGAANAEIALGDIAREEGEPATARAHYHRALERETRHNARGRLTHLLVLTRLLALTEDPAELEELHRPLEAHLADALDGGDWTTAWAVALPVGDWLREKHGPRAWEAHWRRVLDKADGFGDVLKAVTIRIRLAHGLRDLPGRAQDAFELLAQCRTLLARDDPRAPGEGRDGQVSEKTITVYEGLIGLLLDHGDELRLPGGASPGRVAFDLHEEVKSGGLLADLALLPLPSPAGVPAELLAQEGRMLHSVRRLRHGSQARERARTEGDAVYAGLSGQLGELQDRIGEPAPDYARLRAADGARTVDALALVARHAPAEGMVLASYFTGHERTFCFVLASGEEELRTYRIDVGRKRLRAMADGIRRRINGDPDVYPPLGQIVARRPRRLSELDDPPAELLPFQALLADRELLCIAPHGPLAVLPLHALRLRDGSYVTEHAAVVHAPSVSALEYLLASDQEQERKRDTERRLLAVGVAAREDDEPDMYEELSLPRGPGWEVTALTGLDATPLAVGSELERHSLAVLTCHGYASPLDPEDSSLVLTDGRARGSKDVNELNLPESLPFLLRAVDISTPLRMPRTVVLRACSAGWSDPQHPGEDFTGLTRAFFREGTHTLVAPVFNAHRDSSARLLADYLRGVMEGQPSWKALWEARRRMLADTAHPYLAHPYHWGGFISLGDWR
ncbi:CHAT domain-containing protein [Streptomyces sp. NPDC000410]|uniref:CHAT domain-containing protein n=1 Tax=Streptomyces sp. NPDC000410 TaxID=3154254 RepID=UPI00332FEB10